VSSPVPAPAACGRIARLRRGIDLVLQALACVLLFGLLATVMAGIITRALGNPLIWTDEGARFLMAWLAACGWMLAARKRGHVRIRFFQELLPDFLWSGFELVIQAASCVFGAATCWYGAMLVGRNIDLEATSLPLSMAWLYAPLVPAGALILVQSGCDFFLRYQRPPMTHLLDVPSSGADR
jgi:TRAP-type C4-dicarboxylate transport system permease small subunit